MNNKCTCKQLCKASLTCDAIGDIDELTSLLGMVIYSAKKSSSFKIHSIQRYLFIVNGEIATKTQKKTIKPIDVELLNDECAILKNKLNLPTDFIIPGKIKSSAYLDYARAVTRRCERKVVKLFEDGIIKNKYLVEWMNKLSYYLWLLARLEEE